MDLLLYLRTYEPQEPVHFGDSTYCTHEHDNLKIFNGKWCRFSHGIGCYSAPNDLIKVKEWSGLAVFAVFPVLYFLCAAVAVWLHYLPAAVMHMTIFGTAHLTVSKQSWR